MSQTCMVEEARGWSVDDCRRQLSSALPELISKLKATEKPFGLLRMLYTKFVVAAGVRDMESLIFSQIAEQTERMFTDVLDTIVALVQSSTQLHDEQQRIDLLLQNAVDMIGCLEECISGIVSTGAELRVSDVHSLLPVTTYVIHKSYEHCKQSGAQYGELLGAFSQQLSALFKQVHSLQMVFLGLLEKMAMQEKESETSVEDICLVLHRLHDIAVLARDLDVKLTVTLWKAFSKLACQYKHYVRDKLRISRVLSSLCENMTSSFEYLPDLLHGQNASDKGVSKALKVLGFQMKMLVRLTEEYGPCLSQSCVANAYNLCILILRSSPPALRSYRLGADHAAELESQLTNAVPCLLRHLAPLPHFCSLALNYEPNDENRFAHLLLLLYTSDNLHLLASGAAHMWFNYIPTHISRTEADGLEPSAAPASTATVQTINADSNCNRRGDWRSLFHVLFETFSLCYVECASARVTLPGVQLAGQAQRDVTVYECTVVKLCALVASCPPQYFSAVEACLLENVLRRERHRALLAIDVWCFLARFGSAELCRDHCVFLTALYVSMATPQACCHLALLLARLVKFLAPEHQRGYLQQFSVDKYPQVWSILPLHVFTADICAEFTDKIVKNCRRLATEVYSSATHTPAQLLHLKRTVQCSVNLLRHPTVVESHVSASHIRELIPEVTSLLVLFSSCDVTEGLPFVRQCVGAVLELAARLCHAMTNTELVQVLEFIAQLQLDERPVTADMKLSCLAVAASCAGMTFPSCPQQPRILELLASLFRRLLSDDNAVVKQQSLSAFADFAERTSHESVVTACMGDSEPLQAAVVAYINKISERRPMESSATLDDVKCQYATVQQFWRLDSNVIYPPLSALRCFEENSLQEPEAKRQKLEEEELDKATEEHVHLLVTRLKSDSSELGQIMSRITTVPNWLNTDLKNVANTLKNIVPQV